MTQFLFVRGILPHILIGMFMIVVSLISRMCGISIMKNIGHGLESVSDYEKIDFIFA